MVGFRERAGENRYCIQLRNARPKTDNRVGAKTRRIAAAANAPRLRSLIRWTFV